MIRFGQEGMKRILEILNEMKGKGLIDDYAIAGGIAAIYYSEAFLTRDLDFFVMINPKFIKGKIIDPSPIYSYFINLGYSWGKGEYKEHIIVEDIPIEFFVADSNLEKDALNDAITIEFEGTKTKVLKLEYVIAICSKVKRDKDLYKISHLTEQCKIDKVFLDKILKKYNLYNPLDKKCGKHLR